MDAKEGDEPRRTDGARERRNVRLRTNKTALFDIVRTAGGQRFASRAATSHTDAVAEPPHREMARADTALWPLEGTLRNRTTAASRNSCASPCRSARRARGSRLRAGCNSANPCI